MSERSPSEVTRLLAAVSGGDERASEQLLPLVYQELRALARSRMARERPGDTLQPTALVHESYLRLVGSDPVRWRDRGHFFGAAAEAMRRILIERARAKASQKRGGRQAPLPLEEHLVADGEPDPAQVLALDQALQRLEEKDELMARVVKLRFFAGLSMREITEALGSSERTVGRAWTRARAWLHREMQQ